MKRITLIAGIILGLSSLSYGQSSSPPYGLSQLEALSVFNSNYRSGDFDLAITYGQWLLDTKPREIEGVNNFSLEKQFRRFVNIYGKMAGNESDPGMQKEHLDKALEIFDLAFETFEEGEMDSFQWYMDKARLYHDHNRNFTDGIEKAFEQYELAYENDPLRFTEMNEGYYATLLLNYYVSQESKSEAFALIEIIEESENPSLASTVESARDRLISDPGERIEYLESLLEESDDKMEILTEMRDLYNQTGDSDKAFETTRKMYDIDPNFENTKALATEALNNAEYKVALEYLKIALDKAPTKRERRDTAIEISDTYRNIENLESARDYARRAMKIDTDWGQPYMSLAAIYAASISQCVTGRSMKRNDQAVYWLVLDYLKRAGEVDSSVRKSADRQYQTYVEYAPKMADIHFRSEWNIGESLEIGSDLGQCYSWINETTTIRVDE